MTDLYGTWRDAAIAFVALCFWVFYGPPVSGPLAHTLLIVDCILLGALFGRALRMTHDR